MEQVSIFQPHHLIAIIYPATGLVPEVHLLPVQNAGQRYDPRQRVINDPAVIANAGRDNGPESSLYTVSKAGAKISSEDLEAYFAQLADMDKPDLEKLATTFQWLEKVPGETMMWIASYLEGDIVNVCIKCQTNLPLKGEEDAGLEHGGTWSLEQIERLSIAFPSLAADTSSWWCTMLDALHRRTDRAWQHVEFSSSRIPGIEVSEDPWKTPRYPLYEEKEATISHVVTDFATLEDELCPICSDAYDHESHAPLSLKCNDKHVVCRSCYIRSSRAQGLDHARCPFCRDAWFTEDVIRDELKYGLSNGMYIKDTLGNDRYNAFETFERSCSDLDRFLAEDQAGFVLSTANMMLRAFESVVRGARLEEASSTPFHLLPVRCPEFTIVEKAFPDILTRLTHDLHLQTASHVYGKLLHAVMSVLCKAYVNSDVGSHLDFAGRVELYINMTPQRHGLRPGFYEFLCRTLNRSVRLVMLRRCERYETCKGWHMHGERDYYGPDVSKHLESEYRDVIGRLEPERKHRGVWAADLGHRRG